MGNADIFLTFYSQAIDDVIAVGPLLAFRDHGHNIAHGTEEASEKVCQQVRQDDAPLVYQTGRLLTLLKM
jgi:hypothetical protein